MYQMTKLIDVQSNHAILNTLEVQLRPPILKKNALCPVFLVIKNYIDRLRLHQFLGTKTTEVKKLLKIDANEAY